MKRWALLLFLSGVAGFLFVALAACSKSGSLAASVDSGRATDASRDAGGSRDAASQLDVHDASTTAADTGTRPGLPIGMDYSAVDVPDAAVACKTPTVIVKNYDVAGVRSMVQSQLSAMRASGLATLRTFMWIVYPSPDGGTLPAEPNIDIAVSADGGFSPTDLDNLQMYLADVQDAGFSSIEIVFGWQGDSHPYCKPAGGKAGDCYYAPREQSNVAIIVQTAAYVKGSHLTTLKVTYDLANELAPPPAPFMEFPESTIQNASALILLAARTYVSTFVGDGGVNNWTISAPDSMNADRMGALEAILTDAGLKPGHYEQHVYKDNSDDGDWLNGVLVGANKYARAGGVPFTLGEVPYHVEAMEVGIAEFLSATPNNNLAAVLQWPTTFANTCPFDVPPPYTPGVYGDL